MNENKCKQTYKKVESEIHIKKELSVRTVREKWTPQGKYTLQSERG